MIVGLATQGLFDLGFRWSSHERKFMMARLSGWPHSTSSIPETGTDSQRFNSEQRLVCIDAFWFLSLAWWNWHTQKFQKLPPKGLRVQVSPLAPFLCLGFLLRVWCNGCTTGFHPVGTGSCPVARSVRMLLSNCKLNGKSLGASPRIVPSNRTSCIISCL